jgi:alpha-galactosidase
MKSPIILGLDLTTLDPDTLALLANAEVLAINQDALGIQVR